MSRFARIAILLATLAGLGVAVWTFGWAGIGDVVGVMRRIGIGGFLLYCLWSSGVFVILGAAWRTAMPGEPRSTLGRFAWARAVREAVADLLPFSQIGGIVVGARTLTLAGLSPSRVYAALIVDTTTELGSQLLFTIYGIISALLLVYAGARDAAMRPVLVGSGAALIVLIGLVVAAQRYLPRIASGLAGRLLPGAAVASGAVGGELARIYRDRRRVGIVFALNLAAWIASGMGAWIVLRLIGAEVTLACVLTIESLIFTLRSVAFAIPGGLGVQEVAYAFIAPALGLPIDLALALALAKRGRDLTLGLVTIVVWQLLEARSMVTQRL